MWTSHVSIAKDEIKVLFSSVWKRKPNFRARDQNSWGLSLQNSSLTQLSAWKWKLCYFSGWSELLMDVQIILFFFSLFSFLCYLEHLKYLSRSKWFHSKYCQRSLIPIRFCNTFACTVPSLKQPSDKLCNLNDYQLITVASFYAHTLNFTCSSHDLHKNNKLMDETKLCAYT